MGKGTQKVTNTNTPPAEVMQFYRNITSRATNVANKPFQPYKGQIAAGASPLQQQANAGLANMGNVWKPYFDQAQQYAGQSAQQFTPQQFSQQNLSQFLDPFHHQVIDATMANMAEDNARQQQNVVGNSITHGAWGGDRSAIAQSELARQQKLADDQTLANLNSQNYTQALGQFNTGNQLGLSAAQLNTGNAANAAQMYGNLGNAAQSNTLGQYQAMEEAGNQQQATKQNQLNAAYQQYLNKQAYPFQTTQFLAGIGGGAAGGMGGTQTQTSPAPNIFSQILGTGLGLFGAFGAKDGGAINAPQPYAAGGAVLPYEEDAPSIVPDFTPIPKSFDASTAFKPFEPIETTASTPAGLAPVDPASIAAMLGGGAGGVTDPYADYSEPSRFGKLTKGRVHDIGSMGWAMAAGDSPYFLQNVGKAGMAAQAGKQKRTEFEADLAYKNATLAAQKRTAEIEAQRLAYILSGGDSGADYRRAMSDPAYYKYQMDLKKAATPTAETKESQTLGEERGKRAASAEMAWETAPTKISKLHMLGALLHDVDSGQLGPAESNVVGWAQALGIPDETLAKWGLNPNQAIDDQIIQKLVNEFTIGLIGSGAGTQGFPANNFSDADREFLSKIFPQLLNRPETNQIIVEVLSRAEQRKIDFGNAWGKYKDEAAAAGENPSFDKFEREFQAGLNASHSDMYGDLTKALAGRYSAPAPDLSAPPVRPENVPEGSAYSPSRKIWRGTDGKFYDAAGNVVDTPVK